jgi:hypothetical protein
MAWNVGRESRLLIVGKVGSPSEVTVELQGLRIEQGATITITRIDGSAPMPQVTEIPYQDVLSLDLQGYSILLLSFKG